MVSLGFKGYTVQGTKNKKGTGNTTVEWLITHFFAAGCFSICLLLQLYACGGKRYGCCIVGGDHYGLD